MAANPPAARGAANDDVAFFGHPRGLGYIVAAEAGVAFAFWGMVSILTLYLTHRLFTPGHIENIWGMGPYRAAVEGMFGQMTTLGLASQTYGLVSGVMYLTPLLGGLIADRWAGQKLVVAVGLAIQTLSYVAIATEPGFLIGALLLLVGTGCVKSNLVAQVGRLYGAEDGRRTRAYGWFLIAVNIGGFIAPLVVGTVGEKVDWQLGLVIAAVGMAFGTVAYVLGLKHMPPDLKASKPVGPRSRATLTMRETAAIAGILGLLVAEVLNVSTYNQAFNIFPIWAEAKVDRNVLGFTVPVPWFSTLDGILSIVATAAAVRFWGWQAARGKETGDVTRVTIGGSFTTIGFLVLTLGTLVATGAGSKTPIIFPIVFFVFVDAALPWVDTVIQSLISRAAPPALATTMLGVYFLCYAVGNMVVGWLGRLYEKMTPTAFWGLHAAIMGVGVLFLAIFGSRLTRLLLTPEETLTAEPERAAV